MPAAVAGPSILACVPQTRETVLKEYMIIFVLVLLREGDVVRCVLDIEDIDAQTAYTVHKDSSVCMDTALLRVLGHSKLHTPSGRQFLRQRQLLVSRLLVRPHAHA